MNRLVCRHPASATRTVRQKGWAIQWLRVVAFAAKDLKSASVIQTSSARTRHDWSAQRIISGSSDAENR